MKITFQLHAGATLLYRGDHLDAHFDRGEGVATLERGLTFRSQISSLYILLPPAGAAVR